MTFTEQMRNIINLLQSQPTVLLEQTQQPSQNTMTNQNLIKVGDKINIDVEKNGNSNEGQVVKVSGDEVWVKNSKDSKVYKGHKSLLNPVQK